MQHSGSFHIDFTNNGQINMIEGGQFTSSNPNVDLSNPEQVKTDRFKDVPDGEVVTITYTVDLGGSCGVQAYSNDYLVQSCGISIEGIQSTGSNGSTTTIEVSYQTVCPVSTEIHAIATSLTTGISYVVDVQNGDYLEISGLPNGDQYELDLEVGNNTGNRCAAQSHYFNT